LLIVLAIVLVLFGGAKLPQLARSLGEAKREFHNAISAAPHASNQSKAVPAEPNTDGNASTAQMPGVSDRSS
jgi:sec-independent protein translocase protein TatA